MEFKWLQYLVFFFDLGIMQLRREKGNVGTKNKKRCVDFVDDICFCC